MKLIAAIKAFFLALGGNLPDVEPLNLKIQEKDREIRDLQSKVEAVSEELRQQTKQSEQSSMKESGACALLSLMQSEARFIDFVQEDLEAIDDDAQVGSVCRLIHKDLKSLFSGLIKIVPVMDEEEGSQVSIDSEYSVSQIRLSGNVDKKPPFKAALKHKGWMVETVSLPKGQENQDTYVIQPAELEVD